MGDPLKLQADMAKCAEGIKRGMEHSLAVHGDVSIHPECPECIEITASLMSICTATTETILQHAPPNLREAMEKAALLRMGAEEKVH